jgi:hypothetical protein
MERAWLIPEWDGFEGYFCSGTSKIWCSNVMVEEEIKLISILLARLTRRWS